jgi:hypothetical protein
VLNFDRTGPRTFQLDPGRTQRSTFQELLSDNAFTARSHTVLTVLAKAAVLYRITS